MIIFPGRLWGRKLIQPLKVLTPVFRTKRIFLQKNDKFFTNTQSTPKQNSMYFRDNLHLSDRGMHAITSTMRDTLDKIFREFELPV